MPVGEHAPVQQIPESAYFTDTLDTILAAEITPNTIDSVADTALNDLITLIEQCTQAYKANPTMHAATKAESEQFAFNYYGLSSIELVLDQLADKVESIARIDSYIASIPTLAHTITPPDAPERPILPGNGSFEAKKQIPRLKTLLYLLHSELGIDLTEINVEQGTNSDTMLRKESYVAVYIPTLNRLVHVCDEEGNITFVFDTIQLADFGIAATDLQTLTKNDIKDLIASTPNFATALRYTPNWTANLLQALTDDVTTPLDLHAEPVRLVNPEQIEKAPEGVLSLFGIAKNIGGIAEETIKKVIEEIIAATPEQFGEMKEYRFATTITKGYTPEQQEMIMTILHEQGYLGKEAPEGVLSSYGIVKNIGIHERTIRKAIAEIIADKPEQFGEMKEYRFTRRITKGYTPEQQKMIMDFLVNRGLFSEKAPEGVLSVHGIANNIGIHKRTIRKAIAEIIADKPEEFGEVKEYIFTRRITEGYTHEQQSMIMTRLHEQGYLGKEAPEGVLSSYGIANNIGIAERTIRKAIAEIIADKPEEFGEVRKYRFGSKTTKGYTPEQQTMIKEFLEQR